MVTALERAIGEIVNARFLGERGLGTVTIPYGKGIRTAITWKNLGEAGTRDVYSLFGHVVAGEIVFDGPFAKVEGVYIGKGATITTNVDLSADWVQWMGGKTWDNMAAIYAPGVAEEPDDYLVTLAAVYCEGKAVTGQITGVSFSAR